MGGGCEGGGNCSCYLAAILGGALRGGVKVKGNGPREEVGRKGEERAGRNGSEKAGG